MHGTVIKSTGSWYLVRTDDGRAVECKVKGNFRLRGIRSTNPVAVGDGVTIKEQSGETGEAAFITEIDERRNYIIRKASNLSKQSHILAANVDMALLVITIARPETSTTFIDRFLASAEAYRVPVCLAFNKTDDLSNEERSTLDYWHALYSDIGYSCFRLSALKGEGIEPLREMLKGKPRYLQVTREWEINSAQPAHTRGSRAYGSDLRCPWHGNAHHYFQRTFRTSRGWRSTNRHPRCEGLWHFQHGARRGGSLFPRHFPHFGRLPIFQLHTHSRAWLRCAPSTRRPSTSALSLRLLFIHDG